MCNKKKKDKQNKNWCEVIQDKIFIDNQLATPFCIDVTKEWLSYYDDGLYLGCENNKNDNALVALYHNNSIYLLGDEYKTIMYAPKIMFHYINPSHIHIDDVLMKHNNIGNGSIAMRALFKYAKLNGIKIITGYLSDIDNDHKVRRNHYYEKFGFRINENSIIKTYD